MRYLIVATVPNGKSPTVRVWQTDDADTATWVAEHMTEGVLEQAFQAGQGYGPTVELLDTTDPDQVPVLEGT